MGDLIVTELLIILLIFVLSRIVADPWIEACKHTYFTFTKHSPSSALHLTGYAIVVTILVLIVFIILDLHSLVPGGTKNFLYTS
jgi:hypothetical protein